MHTAYFKLILYEWDAPIGTTSNLFIMLSCFLINFTESSDFVTTHCLRPKLCKASGDSQVQFRPPGDPPSMVQKVRQPHHYHPVTSELQTKEGPATPYHRTTPAKDYAGILVTRGLTNWTLNIVHFRINLE